MGTFVRKILVLSLLVTGLTAGPVTAPVAAAAEPAVVPSVAAADDGSVDGAYHRLSPTRILDTRLGVGAPKQPLVAGQTLALTVAGVAGVPATGVSAVVLNVTVTQPVGGGFITAFGNGAKRPIASNVNFVSGQTVPNLVFAPVGADGRVALYSSARTHLVADIFGYYLGTQATASGAFNSVAPTRLLDTRFGVGAPKGRLAGGGTVTVDVAGDSDIPAGSTGAVVVNVTVTQPIGSGYVTAFPAGAARPTASNLNFRVGQTVPNLVIVPVTNGKFSLSTSAGTHLIADVVGYYVGHTPAAAGTLVGLAPTRLLDTRIGVGAPAGPLAGGATLALTVAGRGGVPANGVAAVVLNVTSTAAAGSGYVTVFASGETRPTASNLNIARGLTVPNLVVAPVGADGRVNLATTAGTQLIADVAGYILASDRTVSTVVPRTGTIGLTSANVSQVSGDPNGTQQVRLAAGAPAARVGTVLTASASGTSPNGLLAVVDTVSPGAGGTQVVTTHPATLDQAYSTYRVASRQALTDADVHPVAALRPQATGTGGFREALKATSFSCSGGSGPTITINADLSDVHVDVEMDANVFAPMLNFSVTARPVFDLNLGFTASVTCTLASSTLEATIPITAAPPLVVELRPVIEIGASGTVAITFHWAPRAFVSFQTGSTGTYEQHGFGSSGSVKPTGSAELSAFLGLGVSLSLAGRLGIEGKVGPKLALNWDAEKGCFSIEGSIQVELSVQADLFVKDWSFAVATGTFAKKTLADFCGTVEANRWSGRVHLDYYTDQYAYQEGGPRGPSTADLVVHKRVASGSDAYVNQSVSASGSVFLRARASCDYPPRYFPITITGEFADSWTIRLSRTYQPFLNYPWDVFIDSHASGLTYTSGSAACGGVTSDSYDDFYAFDEVGDHNGTQHRSQCENAFALALEQKYHGTLPRTISGEASDTRDDAPQYPIYDYCHVTFQLTQEVDANEDGRPDNP